MSRSPAMIFSYWKGPSHFRGTHFLVERSLKYWLENLGNQVVSSVLRLLYLELQAYLVGFTTQGLTRSNMLISLKVQLRIPGRHTHRNHFDPRDIVQVYAHRKAQRFPEDSHLNE